jgi:putative transposase
LYRSCTHPRIPGFITDFENIRTGRHRVFILYVHLVFVTKYGHRVFTAPHLERIGQIMRDVCGDFGCELAEFNGEPSTCTCW